MLKNFAVVRIAAMVGVALWGFSRTADSVALIMLTLLALMALGTGTVLSLRNFVVAYHFLVLGIGPYVINVSNRGEIQALGCALFAAFLAGVGIVDLAKARRPRSPYKAQIASPPALMVPRGTNLLPTPERIPRLLLAAALAQLAGVALAIRQYGLGAYLSGASLAGKISAYGHDAGLDGVGIAHTLINIFAVAAVAAYAAQHELDRRYSWGWLITIMFVLPFIRLDRSVLIVNVIGLVFLAARSRRPRKPRGQSRAALLLLLVVVAFASAFGIGVLRSNALAVTGQQVNSSSSIVVSELSPVIVVADASRSGAERFGGSTLYLPMALRLIPKMFYSGKPTNTTARYMMEHDPQSFRAGYSLAPTALGVVLLNYGEGFAVVLSMIAGILLSMRRDLMLLPSGILMLLYLSTYTLVRDDPSNSIPTVVLSAIIYAFLRKSQSPSRADGEDGLPKCTARLSSRNG